MAVASNNQNWVHKLHSSAFETHLLALEQYFNSSTSQFMKVIKSSTLTTSEY